MCAKGNSQASISASDNDLDALYVEFSDADAEYECYFSDDFSNSSNDVRSDKEDSSDEESTDSLSDFIDDRSFTSTDVNE